MCSAVAWKIASVVDSASTKEYATDGAALAALVSGGPLQGVWGPDPLQWSVLHLCCPLSVGRSQCLVSATTRQWHGVLFLIGGVFLDARSLIVGPGCTLSFLRYLSGACTTTVLYECLSDYSISVVFQDLSVPAVLFLCSR